MEEEDVDEDEETKDETDEGIVSFCELEIDDTSESFAVTDDLLKINGLICGLMVKSQFRLSPSLLFLESSLLN